jgi:O-antigen/teichoic acid export membrane protein
LAGGLRSLREDLFSSRKGIRDVAVSMAPQGVSLVTGLASAILLTRGLGPSGFGQYELVLSVVGVVFSLSELGIGQTSIRYASRAVARGDTRQQYAILQWAFRLRLGLATAVSLVLFFVAPILSSRIWHIDGLSGVLRLGLLAGIFGVLAAIPSIYYQSTRQFGMNARVLVSQSFIAFGGILILALLDRWSVFLVVLVTVAASAVRGLLFILLIPKASWLAPGTLRDLVVFRLSKILEPFQPRPHSKGTEAAEEPPGEFAFYMLLSSVLVMLTLRADLWLIGVYLDDYQIGLYSAAMRLTIPLSIILGAMNTALWPRVSSVTSASETIHLLKKTLVLSAAVAFAGAIYALVAPPLAPWLFGDSFRPTVLLGQLLSLRFCLAIVICPVGVIGYAFGLVRVYWVINLAQLIVTVVLNAAFLSLYGPIVSALVLILDDVIASFTVSFLVFQKIKGLESKTARPDMP